MRGHRSVPSSPVASDFLPALHAVRPVPPPNGVRVLPRKTLPGHIDSQAPAGPVEPLLQDATGGGVPASVGVGSTAYRT
ncbi:MAG: hypothetical protein ABL982_12965 [Vicinamibacterales bacterium]